MIPAVRSESSKNVNNTDIVLVSRLTLKVTTEMQLTIIKNIILHNSINKNYFTSTQPLLNQKESLNGV